MVDKIFVLDTNVLLHDPDALEKFRESAVVMPLVVLEELDKLKSFSDELGKNARHVIRFIDQLQGDLFKGIQLKNGGTFFLFVEDLSLLGDFSFSLHRSKHRVLLAAYQLKQKSEGEVNLISKDFVLRIKAESVGIAAKDYDPLKTPYDNLYTGIRDFPLSKQEFDSFLTKGCLTLTGEQWIANEYFRFTCAEKSAVFGRYCGKKKEIQRTKRDILDVWGVKPLNDEQFCAMDVLMNDAVQLVTLMGQAGTGKTLMALICGLRKVFDEGAYRRILISRPIMPLGRDIGYLPGTKEEKLIHWMQPIYDNLEYICEMISGSVNHGDTKKWILESERIEMEAVTFIRGRSFARTFMIIDEAQNLTPHEVKTIISRAGKGTKVVLTGDPTQIDNPYLNKESNALTYVVNQLKSEAIYGHIMLQKTERSELAALAAKLL